MPTPGVGNDITEILRRSPAEGGRSTRRIGDEIGGIAGAAVPALDRHAAPADALDCGNDFVDGGAFSGTEVERLGLSAADEMLGGAKMRRRKILDMDVVADRRSVGCRIVGAEDTERRTATERGLDDQRKKMRLAFVPLADLAGGIGTGRIEVTHSGGSQPVGPLEIAEHALEGELRCAIGIDRPFYCVLGDRHLVRHAVNRACRREDDPVDLLGQHRLEKAKPAGEVDVVIGPRVGHGFADKGECSEMHDGRWPDVAHHRPEALAVADIALDQRPPFDEFAVTRREIVVDDRLEAGPGERLAAVATDIAGAAGHEDAGHSAMGPSSPERRLPPKELVAAAAESAMILGAVISGFSMGTITRGLFLSRLHFIPALRLAYLNNAKVACSSIKEAMWKRADEANGRETYAGKPHERDGSPFEFSKAARDKLLTATFFSAVRNPYSRILSAYLNKIASPTRDPYVWGWFANRYGLDKSTQLTFRQFLDRISADDPQTLDWHFCPQFVNLLHPICPLDFLGNMENFAPFKSQLASDGLDLGFFAPHRTRADERLREFYDRRNADIVRGFYELDFDLYGYGDDPEALPSIRPPRLDNARERLTLFIDKL
jgi:hypothetical protein